MYKSFLTDWKCVTQVYMLIEPKKITFITKGYLDDPMVICGWVTFYQCILVFCALGGKNRSYML